jgi:hypothetical protein
MEDTLAFYGGAVKALGGGKVGGYLVLFSGPDKPDLQGEFFTKSTDFSLENGESRPIYYRHGSHPLIKSRIGKAVLTVDDVGVFVEGELDLRNKYIRALYSKAEEKKDEPFLGWSSGSMTHLVEMKAVGTVKEILSWPIGEASLTPVPVEPRTIATTLKDLSGDQDLDLEAMVKSLEEPEDEGPVSLDGLPALKALCEALSPAVNINLVTHSQLADAAVKELLTHGRVFVDAFKHYCVRIDDQVESRKKRNRKAVSDSQESDFKSWKDGLSEVNTNINSVVKDLEDTLKLTEDAKAQADAAEKHAQFLMQRLDSLTSIIAKE